MKLTKKNVLKFLKDEGACASGMRQLRRLLRQKKSMEYVFERMAKIESKGDDWNLGWLFEQMDQRLCNQNWNHRSTYYRDNLTTFQDFKKLFEQMETYEESLEREERERF